MGTGAIHAAIRYVVQGNFSWVLAVEQRMYYSAARVVSPRAHPMNIGVGRAVGASMDSAATRAIMLRVQSASFARVQKWFVNWMHPANL